jgi:hypothetical protein
VCHYSAWKADAHAVDVVEIAATGEEWLIQVAGTLHELGRVLAGMGVGHGSGRKKACERLGLRRARSGWAALRAGGDGP